MKVMICSSDNCATSGAFLCMFELCRYMKNENIEILVILPSNGTGTELLKKHNINYKIVKSYSWVMPINGGIIKRPMPVSAIFEFKIIVRGGKVYAA